MPAQHFSWFVANSFERDYASSTMTSMVSAISSIHKLFDSVDPTECSSVKKLLQGCRKLKRTSDSRLSISPGILEQVLSASRLTIII